MLNHEYLSYEPVDGQILLNFGMWMHCVTVWAVKCLKSTSDQI